MDDQRLSVGEIAHAAGLTAEALRHYDRVGLFRPDGTDDGNGYRWYAADRLPQARLIARLRSVGVPLSRIAECLTANGDTAVVRRVLEEHRRRLESRSTLVRGDLHRLAHLLDDEAADDGGPGDDRTAAPDLPAPRAGEQERRPADERVLAADLFNGVCRLMEIEDRAREQDDRMLHMAHASRHHWEQVGTPANLARGEWLCSRVYTVLRRPEPALHHARRVLEICEEHGIGDWDLAFAHEALARAHAVAGNREAALEHARTARAIPIAADEDRDLLLIDLQTVPGLQPLPDLQPAPDVQSFPGAEPQRQ